MAVELIVAPGVELDLTEAYAWYESRRVGLGEEFLSAVDASMERGVPPSLDTAISICHLLRVRGNGSDSLRAVSHVP